MKNDTGLPRCLLRLASGIEAVSGWFGRLSAWVVLVMVVVIVYDVAMRYLFQAGSVALQELEWHLFALVFLFAGAYTLREDSHVRVDMLYRSRRFGERGRAWADLIGVLVFLIPFCLLIIWACIPFVQHAYQLGEGSPDPGGLPYRYLLKAAIPVGFGLLLLQGIAMAIRCLERLGRVSDAELGPDS